MQAARRPALRRRVDVLTPFLLLVALVLALMAASGCGSAPVAQQRPGQGNAIHVIAPYRHQGTWVFDDTRVGLRQEPFVAGIPVMIDRLVADIPAAEAGFRLLFSDKPFPGHSLRLDWDRAEHGGNWYRAAGTDAEGWLCPALYRYFARAPQVLYVAAEPL